MRGELVGDAAIVIDENWAKAGGRAFSPVESLDYGFQGIKFAVLGSPLEIMDHLKDLFAWYDGEKGEKDLTLKLSKSAWKVQVIAHE